MIRIGEIVRSLETLANPQLQESYDNAGLMTGNMETECTGVLISLDATELIIEEARKKNCNMVVTHHPIIFRGLKKLTGANYVERTIIKAIKNDISIFAIHTNLDNVLHGVSSTFANLFHLKNPRVLSERRNSLKKLVTFVPSDYAEKVRSSLFDSGAGAIGRYDQCSFNIEATGTFRPLKGADPFSGRVGERFEGNEVRIEVVFPFYLEKKVIGSLFQSHPYEEIAYYISELSNTEKNTGSGLVGDLENPVSESDFLKSVKELLHIKAIKHTAFLNKPVKRVAFCGGSGFFLLPNAIAAGADIFVTADIKYHEFFDADGKIVLADAGHFETEQFAVQLLAEYLQNKFPTFAVLKTEHQTNPVHYLS